MKRTITLILLFFVIQSNAALSAPIDDGERIKHPSFVTFNEKYYDENGFKSRYLGKAGALSGTVIEIEKAANDTFIFQLALEKSENKLWVGFLVRFSEQPISIGDNIAVLGYFDESEKEPEFIAKLSDSKEYLLGFCMIEKRLGLPIFYKELLPKCMEWENGSYNFDSSAN